MNQTVLILDFGGQNNQLLARKVRDNNVYCELLPYNVSVDKIKQKNPIGIIFTGETGTLNGNLLMPDPEVYSLNIPILGICYGSRLLTAATGKNISAGTKEFDIRTLKPVNNGGKLLNGVNQSDCRISTNCVENLPKDFTVTAKTEGCTAAAFECESKKLYGIQFQPESVHTAEGDKIIKNFLYGICGAKGEWTMASFANKIVEDLKIRLKGKKGICALSGGVDSAVAAALVHKACPDLICIFVDHGLMRKGEPEEVVTTFRDNQKINLIKIDARERFLNRLQGVTDPERKRKIIGEEFIRVFEEESRKIGAVDFLVQGTIYADIIESGIGGEMVKSHHNVGGLPSVVDFKDLVEPLKDLFKDEVRACGKEIGLPDSMVMRQPFPGPGLGIRVIGEITEERLDTLRDADLILREEIKNSGLNNKIWQYFVVLLNTRSVGVTGDSRTYSYTAAIRAVHSVDGMTADWARIPFDVLQKISNRIVSEVKDINRVVYDITPKPPATIEFE